MNTILLAIALAASTPANAVQTAKETVIVVQAQRPAKSMVCGAPRPLQSDAVQTVRLCEFK